MMMILNICYKITINNGNDGGGGYGCGDDAVDYKDNVRMRIMVIIVITVVMQTIMMRSFSRHNVTSEAIVQWSASFSAL